MLAGNEAFIPNSYESIATLTGTGSNTSVTFSSIPSTYKHLQVRAIARGNSGGNTNDTFNIRLNSDTGTNYSQHLLQGNGSTVVATGGASVNYLRFMVNTSGDSSAANIMGTAIFDLIDYADTSKYKTSRSFYGVDQNTAGVNFVGLASGVWMSTSAVNSITVYNPFSDTMSASTTFALYGIKG